MDTATRAIHNFAEGEMFDNRYRLVARAGSGGFADVWRAEDTLRNDRVVALKIYTRLDDDGIKQMSLEYNETEYIQHPNLLTGNHFAAVGNIPYMEMRYCDGGSLAKRVGSMDSGEIRNVLHDVLSGLAYLHSQGIVHQDIKPENILHDSTHNVYMLADFGISGKSRTRLSKSVQRDSNSVSMTLAYAPPDKFSSNPVDREPNTKGDIFSLGVTLYELATGTLPFEQPVNTGERMLNCEGNVKVYFDNIADPTLRQMAQRCIQYRKEDRPTAEELLAMLSSSTGNTTYTLKQRGTAMSENGRHNKTVKITDTPTAPRVEGTQKVRRDKPDNKPHKSRWWFYLIGVIVAISPYVFLSVYRDSRGTKFTANGVSFRMIEVKRGAGAYYMGETEVTQELWQAVMWQNPSGFKGTNRPVENVSWNDCQEFISKLNAITGQKFRLPSEAEWEFAAKGGNKSKGYKYSGSNDIDDVAWYWDNSSGHTHAVKRKKPNELGIYDMSGNVWEWCEDTSGTKRIIRGCSWYESAGLFSESNRDLSTPIVSGPFYGLRLAL